MSAFVPFPDGAQVEVVYVLDGQVMENRFWFWTDTPPIDHTALQGLADGVYGWHTAKILPFLSSALQLAAVEAKDWSADPPPDVAVAGPPINGGADADCHSANVAAFVKFRWPNQLRHLRRNGNFVPGVPKSAVELNTPTPEFKDAIWSGYVDLIDDTRLFTPVHFWWWVVTSAFTNGVPRSEQVFGQCIGPPPRQLIRLGQRRKRLPIS